MEFFHGSYDLYQGTSAGAGGWRPYVLEMSRCWLTRWLHPSGRKSARPGGSVEGPGGSVGARG